MKPERHLVLGGARSGKTGLALRAAAALEQALGAQVVYVATAESRDAEMQDRIERHRQERPAAWRTIEAPRQLGRALSSVPADAIIVVDCLTLWLSNALLSDFSEEAPKALSPTWNAERTGFMSHLQDCKHSIILVSNEVGGGIVPVSPLARRFQDEQGWLNQAVAAICERVTLAVAGIAVSIKAAADA